MFQLTFVNYNDLPTFLYCTGNNNFDKAINLDISLLHGRMSI